MTITTRDQLIDALANNSSRLIVDKNSTGISAAAGSFQSYWRGIGQPAQAAIPGAAAVCNNTTLGALGFAQQTAPVTSYLALIEISSSVAVQTIEIHDRLAHMGGLNGTLTTAQTVGIDLQTLDGTDNVSARKGDSNYSDVQWWLEWYTQTGGTAVTATVNVTYSDGSTGNLSAISLAATRPAAHMVSLNAFNPSAGLFIRGINSVTLSATTGAAGSFGVTATRYRSGSFCPVANARFTSDWASTGLPEIQNSSCLFVVMLASTATSTAIRATGKIVHG